ncbi:unnamed protein product [Tilletia controversa]|uniref:Dolichyl-diphosphooligosaccharide--protein glycosyltransferase subunit OST2 n=2 Tax=Tilletia TaxID=13289 RepID=A0A177UZ09_9BASI|nr:hypothetical protein CF328_g5420 [Tilletia controversa]KAE8195769.1 hypothetical protein CF335_g5016 [Tilletia laevis]KAE8265021.1 hypothetical protein A4X03_0g536 [Tilletia caries]KAE8196253.1 hypothetical protein CF336_g2716 [Tilletia laevis]CAD6890999.1 unnamed protein product [Tilletia caries]
MPPKSRSQKQAQAQAQAQVQAQSDAAATAVTSSSSAPTTASPTPPQQQQSTSTPTPAALARKTQAASQDVISSLISSYNDSTPAHLKLIDAFCVFLVLTGVIQFGYCVAVTNFPFNSFISGFAATVGQFVLAASLRIQANAANASDFPKVSPERAFADFLFGSVILHFFVINFLG